MPVATTQVDTTTTTTTTTTTSCGGATGTAATPKDSSPSPCATPRTAATPGSDAGRYDAQLAAASELVRWLLLLACHTCAGAGHLHPAWRLAIEACAQSDAHVAINFRALLKGIAPLVDGVESGERTRAARAIARPLCAADASDDCVASDRRAALDGGLLAPVGGDCEALEAQARRAVQEFGELRAARLVELEAARARREADPPDDLADAVLRCAFVMALCVSDGDGLEFCAAGGVSTATVAGRILAYHLAKYAQPRARAEMQALSHALAVARRHAQEAAAQLPRGEDGEETETLGLGVPSGACVADGTVADGAVADGAVADGADADGAASASAPDRRARRRLEAAYRLVVSLVKLSCFTADDGAAAQLPWLEMGVALAARRVHFKALRDRLAPLVSAVVAAAGHGQSAPPPAALGVAGAFVLSGVGEWVPEWALDPLGSGGSGGRLVTGHGGGGMPWTELGSEEPLDPVAVVGSLEASGLVRAGGTPMEGRRQATLLALYVQARWRARLRSLEAHLCSVRRREVERRRPEAFAPLQLSDLEADVSAPCAQQARAEAEAGTCDGSAVRVPGAP